MVSVVVAGAVVKEKVELESQRELGTCQIYMKCKLKIRTHLWSRER